MKEITSIKYECSDGTRFEDLEKAQKHEFRWQAEKDSPEDSRLTVAGLVDKMFSDPLPFIDMLTRIHTDQLKAEAAEEVAEAAE